LEQQAKLSVVEEEKHFVAKQREGGKVTRKKTLKKLQL